MIIKVDNDNRKDYETLFTKAYQALLLKEEETQTSIIKKPNELGRFVSLEEFFSQIADIYSANPSFLIRLPVDETVLKIDAEKRTIDTSLFKNCVTVQSDQVAEIAIFSIDRYFDYMDFMETEIWVQWTAPNADGTVKQGATLIELKDVETEPGKVRFGWPLDADITANPGTVHFAVRFFKRGDVEVFDSTGASKIENKIIYSFNTSPATLVVKPALQPNLNSENAINKPHSLFTYSIRNSIYAGAGEGTTIPQTPQFAAPGLDLPVSATLKKNTLTLKAQAVVGDTGNIRYEWYYTPVGGTRRKCAEHKNKAGETVPAFGVINDNHYEETTATTAVLSDNYYIDGENGAKIPYRGALPHPEGKTVYEKYTTFTVPTTGDVTGIYQVEAVNNNGFIDGYTVASYECVLVSPSSVVVTENNKLAKFAIIQGEAGSEKAVLSIVPTIAADDNSEYTYEWYRSDSKDGVASIVKAFSADNTLEIGNKVTVGGKEVDGTGWYSVKVHSSLNRETRTYESEHRCKVTMMPAAPALAFNSGVQASGDNAIFTAAIGDTLDFVVNATVDKAQGLKENDLYSEDLTYKWTIQPADEPERDLAETDIVDGTALTSKAIQVKVTEAATYTCTVTNHLNEKTASDELSFIVMLTDAE